MKCSQFTDLRVKYSTDQGKNRPCAHERVIVGESITGNKKFNRLMFHKILEIPPPNLPCKQTSPEHKSDPGVNSLEQVNK